MTVQKVAIAGPTGTLGPSIIFALLRADFNITLLTRNATKTATQYPNLPIVQTTYDSVPDIAASLKPLYLDSIIVLLPRTSLKSHINLIEASILAGIPHMIPSSFGGDLRNPRIGDLPPFREKRAMEEYLVARAKEGRIGFTIVNTGLFLDWAMKENILLNLTGEESVRIFDGGKTKISATALEDIGKAVVGVLRMNDAFVNRYCSVHSVVVTQNQLLGYVRELWPEKQFETVQVDTLELVNEAAEKMKRDEQLKAEDMRAFILRENFGKGTNYFERADNEVLGIEIWDEARLKRFMRQIIEL